MAVAEIPEPLTKLLCAIREGGSIPQIRQQFDGAIVSLRRSFRDPRRNLLPNRVSARRYVVQVFLPRFGLRADLTLALLFGLLGEARCFARTRWSQAAEISATVLRAVVSSWLRVVW